MIKKSQVESVTEELGKIESVRLGNGGYQDAMFGFTFTLAFSDSCAVTDFKGMWSSKPDKHCKWTKDDQIKKFGEDMLWLIDLMNKAKVAHFYELKGKPVAVKINNQTLVSWRILTEVL